jgi:amino acid permease
MLHVSFHNFTAMVGAGVLALPSVLAALGWAGGVSALVLSWAISFVTFIFLVKLHEIKIDDKDTARMDRYPKLTTYAFGPRLGFWMLTPFQIAQFIGLPIAYAITGATSLQNIVSLLAPDSPWGGKGGGLSRWIVVFSAIQLVVVQVRSFSQLAYVSLIGAVGSLFYISVSFVGSLVRGRQPGVSYGLPVGLTSTSDRVFGTFNALATAAFAYGGHNIACEIQGTLPAPPSSIPRMQLSVLVTFALTALCYFSVAITGYWAFGSAVADNILTSLSRPVGAIVAANLAVFFHVLGKVLGDGAVVERVCHSRRDISTSPRLSPFSLNPPASYHVFLFPLLDIFDGQALKWGILPSSLQWRLLLRSTCVVSIAVVASALPFFGTILAFIGALCITPTTFLMPALLWWKLKKPTWKQADFYFCIMTLIVMTAVMVLGATGAVRDLILQVFKPVNGKRAPSFEW